MWHRLAASSRPNRAQLGGVVCAALLVLFAVTGVRAQYPVNTRVDLSVRQDGRMLDRNPQLGGTGYNYTRPLSPLIGGNPYASGIIGRGLSLQSFSPIPDPTAFRGSLGSAALYNFRRDSVSSGMAGLPLDSTGYAFAQPYYDPSTTVVSPGFLQGLTAPSGGSPAVTPPLDLRIPARMDLGIGQYTQLTLPSATPTPPSLPGTWATTSSIFGPQPPPRVLLPTVPGSEDSGNQRTGRTTGPRGTERIGNTALNPLDLRGVAGSKRVPETPLDAVLRGGLRPPVGLIEPGREPSPLASAARPGEVRPGLIVPEEPGARRAPAGGPAKPLPPTITDTSVLPGYDVFNDLRLALAVSRDPGAAWIKDMQQAVSGQLDPTRATAKQAGGDAQQFLDQMLKSPLKSFAGDGSSGVNDQMLKAEALMEIGHYSEAADRYDMAHLLDPISPLPLVGKGHALLASGDYRSAAHALMQGLERFPELSRFSLDLTKLMGGGEIIDIRRSKIMEQLKQQESPELRFLLGYLEYHTGRRDSGLKNLEQAGKEDWERAVKEGQSGSIIERYPAMLRGEGALPPPKLPLDGPVVPPPEKP